MWLQWEDNSDACYVPRGDGHDHDHGYDNAHGESLSLHGYHCLES